MFCNICEKETAHSMRVAGSKEADGTINYVNVKGCVVCNSRVQTEIPLLSVAFNIKGMTEQVCAYCLEKDYKKYPLLNFIDFEVEEMIPNGLPCERCKHPFTSNAAVSAVNRLFCTPTTRRITTQED